MNHDQRRSNTRERFPPIPPGRTFLSSSSESDERERPLRRIDTQKPCLPAAESTKRQRSESGRSSTSLTEEIKRLRPGSGQSLSYAVIEEIKYRRPDSGRYAAPVMEEIKRQKSSNAHSLSSVIEETKLQRPSSGQNLTTPPEITEALTKGSHMNTAAELDDKVLLEKAKREEDKLKSFSAEQFRNVYSPATDLSSNSTDLAANRAPTPAVVDAKAERKRRRREKREKEARKTEEARKKEHDKLEAERMVAEISRNRSMFNGNRDTLPAIGRKTADVNLYIGKMPKIQEHDLLAPTLPENNATDVIRKHETQVRTTAFFREVNQDYMNASVELMEPFRKNEAVEIIDRHEEEFGRLYTTSYLTRNYGSADKPSSAKSRCSSRVSRWGAL